MTDYIRTLLVMLGLAIGFASGPAHAADSAASPVGTIPLPGVTGRIDHMAATPDGRWLFVAALGSNRVLRIDTQTAQVSGVITGVRAPQGICYLPKSGELAVASGGGGSLRFYTAKLRPVGIVRGLDDADNVRYDADANLVYVGYGQGALAVIDPDRVVQTARIPLDGHPESFQLEQHGTRIFINVPTAGEIEVFDRANRRLLNEWKIKDGGDNFPMALDEADKRLFIGTRKPPRMLVLETEAGKEIALLSACGDTDDLFYDAPSRLIYLSGGQGCVSVFHQTDSVTYDRGDTVNTFSGARTSMLVPSMHRLYVAVPRRVAQRAQILVFETP
jgi:YVTN family beta-propeller protein